MRESTKTPEITDPEMKKWDNLIRIGETARAANIDATYKDNLEYLQGEQLKGGKGYVPITQNLYDMTLRTMVSALLAQNTKPRVYAELQDLPSPKDVVAKEFWEREKKEMRRQARINQALLVKTTKEGDLEAEARKMVTGWIAGPRAGILIGYGAVFGEETGSGEKEKYTIAKAGKKVSPAAPDRNVKRSKVLSERLWYRYVSPKDYFYDPSVTCLEDSPWLYIEEDVPLDYVRNNENFDKKVRKEISASGSFYKPADMANVRGFSQKLFGISGMNHRGFPKEAESVRLGTIYDRRGGKLRILARGSESMGFLSVQDWHWKKLEGFPFVDGTFRDVPDTQWSQSVLEILRGVQDQMNRLDKQIADYQAKLTAVILIDKGVLEEEDVEKFMKAEFSEGFLTNANKGTIRFIESTGIILQHLLARRRDLWDIYARISHLPEWLTMGQSMRARSAEEASAIKQGFSSFVNEKIYRVEKFYEKVYTKSLQMIHDLYTRKHAVQIMGELGDEWQEFDPETAMEELAVGIVPYSSLPATPQMELERTKIWLQTSAQTSAAVPGLVKMGLVVKDVAEQMMPGRDTDRYFNAQMLEALETDKPAQEKLGMGLSQMMAGAGSGPGAGMGPQLRPIEAPPF